MSVSEPAAPVEKVGIFSIIFGVFASPAKAFEGFKQKPSIWVPLIVLIVLSVVVALGMTKYNSIEQYEMMKTSTTMPEQALERIHQAVENPNYVGAIIGGIFMPVIFTVLAALIAWFICGFVFGGSSKFMAIWGVTILGGLITSVGNLIRLPLVMAKESVHVSFGFAALMSGKDFTSILYTLAYYVDVFAIWGMIVTGIGYGVVFGIKRGQGIAASVITSLVLICAFIGMMVFVLSFAGVKVSFF